MVKHGVIGLRVANGLKIVYVAGYGSNRTDVQQKQLD